MAKLDPYTYEPKVGPKTGDWGKDYRAEYEAIAKEEDEAIAKYEETGKVPVGAIYRAPYADGYATYRVSKLRPFTVQHVAAGDAWALPAPHVRGLTVDDFAQGMNRQVSGIFGRR